MTRILLVSTYELGHQPLHVASPGAALLGSGHDVRALDLSVDPWDDEPFAWADKVAFSVPMHTAARLALRASGRVRDIWPDVPICFFGLYAWVGRHARDAAAFTGEYEPALVAWAADEHPSTGDGLRLDLGRHARAVPARHLLPPLDRYARLSVAGEHRLVGAVEAGQGCASRCRHCPVAAVYDGRTRPVDEAVVLADIAQLVSMGARHVSFADPDFLSRPHHSLRVVRAMQERFPTLTFDCTTKVSLVLRHESMWPELAAAGCLFVVSAFESTDDATLTRLDKGHTAADAARVVVLLREHGIDVRPSFLPFTPWTTAAQMCDLLDFVAEHDLVGNVDPVQYGIRLLVPDGSLLLSHPDLQAHLGPYDQQRLSWTWTTGDPMADRLQQEVAGLVECDLAAGVPSRATFDRVRAAACVAAGRPSPAPVAPSRAAPDPPHLTEPWFCCAEPTGDQLGVLG